ncbi:MAG: DUF1876 domain-containing protein [Actinomycetes bacterium]
MEQKTWTVRIDLVEHGSDTRATAQLSTDDGREARGAGVARRNPSDPDVPQIGDELATARALGELAHHLLEMAARDIEASTSTPAQLPG